MVPFIEKKILILDQPSFINYFLNGPCVFSVVSKNSLPNPVTQVVSFCFLLEISLFCVSHLGLCSFFKKIVYLFWAMLGLCCHAGFFLNVVSRGYSVVDSGACASHCGGFLLLSTSPRACRLQ